MGDAAMGDVATVVRYETLVGDGLVQRQPYEKALKYFNDALDIARSQAEIQHPLMLYSGKIEAWIGLGRIGEAKALLDKIAHWRLPMATALSGIRASFT